MFIEEEWSRLLTLKTRLLRQFCSEKLLQIRKKKIHSNKKTLLEKVTETCRSKVLLSIDRFSSTPLCWNLIFTFLTFLFFLNFARVKLFYIKNLQGYELQLFWHYPYYYCHWLLIFVFRIFFAVVNLSQLININFLIFQIIDFINLKYKPLSGIA